MVLTDSDILQAIKHDNIVIKPFDRSRLGSNSYDLTLSEHLANYDFSVTLDCATDNKLVRFQIPEDGYVMLPGILYLGSTREFTATSKFMPYIEGKSSIGRLGITAHITAGAGDIGFAGHWTLEITVVHPIRVYAGMPIAQILFMLPLSKCLVPYGVKGTAKYQNQQGLPMPSQMYKNFTQPQT